MSIGQLKGYSVPALGGLVSSLSHTYVKGSNGKEWGCFGTTSGGKCIASGNGDLAVAERLAGFRSWAGICYGITGVCHQASNRILSPSEQTVNRADGYFLSVATFGEYGVGDVSWANRQASKGQPFSRAFNSGKSILLDSLEKHRKDVSNGSINPIASLDAVGHPPQRSSQKRLMSSLGSKWQLVAVETAIDYLKGNMGLIEYAQSINDDATNFVFDVANIFGQSKTESIMGMEFTEQTKFELVEARKMEDQN
ncbi:hypothetical protein [Vibrio sp. ED002]|uniref:hypothetical protein n=1 Tax=Vibrio sp. ED002 TaxID=2785123 RepID=UPI00200E18EE|nr:hypothetical protein [Vibrio sp. ED002]UQA50990.1 hypothetical protein ITG12_01220 [Vibrio sp. ED002]